MTVVSIMPKAVTETVAGLGFEDKVVAAAPDIGRTAMSDIEAAVDELYSSYDRGMVALLSKLSGLEQPAS